MYPRVPAAQAHLLRDFTSQSRETTAVQMGDGGGQLFTMSISKLAQKIAAERRIPLAEAQVQAVRLREQGKTTNMRAR